MTSAFHLSLLRFAPPFLALLLCLNSGRKLTRFSAGLTQQAAGQTDSFQRGLSALQDGRLEDALAELAAAERERPDDPLVHNFRGIVLARLGQNDEAASEYHQAIRLNPRMADAYRNLGFLMWTGRQFQSAREALRRAVELSPDDSFAHYYLGRVLLDEQNYAPAIHELDASHVPLPLDTDFSIQLAGAYIAVGRGEEARKSLARLSTPSLDDTQAIHVAALFLALHENDAAIDLIQHLNQRSAPSEPTWRQFDLALVYLLSANYGKAIGQADRYNNSLPRDDSKARESADAWTILGIAAARLQQDERSLNAFRHAATLRPGAEEPWLNLTRQLMELSRYSEAISALQDALAADPKSYALNLRMGAAQLAAGHYAEAEKIFRDLVTAGDPLPTGYVGLAQVLLRTGHATEAAAELAAAQRKLGPNFLLSYFLGLALDRSGQPLEAVTAFQEAARLDPGNAEAHLYLGKTELGLGRVKDAIAELQEALRLQPGNEQVKRLLSKAYGRAGDRQSAETLAEPAENGLANPETDLLGDFFVPQWQVPTENPVH